MEHWTLGEHGEDGFLWNRNTFGL